MSGASRLANSTSCVPPSQTSATPTALRCFGARSWPARLATVLLAAHHGAVDGLGLLGLLGVACGSRAVSSARGVGAAPPRGSITGWAAARTLRALASPPPRVAPARRRSGETGHWLARSAVPTLSGGTAQLAAAAVRALADWNGERAEPIFPAIVAIGASHRSGAEITFDNQAAWLRVALESGEEENSAAVLAAAEPQPVAPPWSGTGLASAAIALVAGRMGSTLLVSNLGSVTGIEALDSLAFWPVAYGRSAVAVGAATVAGETTLTIRVPSRAFAAQDAERLVGAVAAQLRAPAPALRI